MSRQTFNPGLGSGKFHFSFPHASETIIIGTKAFRVGETRVHSLLCSQTFPL